MERQKEQADNLASEWYKRAQLALSKVGPDIKQSLHPCIIYMHILRVYSRPTPKTIQGDEELAREALSRRQQQVKEKEMAPHAFY